MLYLRLLAAAIAGALLLEGVDSCLRNAPQVDQWDGETWSDLSVSADRGEINTLTVIMSDYTFHCNGTISQWKLQWSLSSFRYEQCTLTFTFYTLRPDAGNDCILTPAGSNTVTVRIDGSRISSFARDMESTFNISIEDRIIVKPGDIVGLRVQTDRYCDDMRLWIAGTRFTDNTVYHERFEEDEDSSRRDFDRINICRYEREEISPYITAVVEPLTEATPTNVHPTETSTQESTRTSEQTAVSTVTTATTVATVTTVTMYQPQSGGSVRMTRRVHFGGSRPAMAGAEDSGGNMVILTSVGASVGGLLVVAAALTAVLCVWQCSRRRISQSTPKVPPQYSMAENEAYGARTQHPQQQQVRNGRKVSDVAPERLQQNPQFMMEENEAYDIHTHHPQETDLNGYYDAVEWKEEEGNDYVVNELVYDLPS